MKNIKLIAVPLASTIKYEIGKRYNFYSFKDLIVFSEKRSNLTPAFSMLIDMKLQFVEKFIPLK